MTHGRIALQRIDEARRKPSPRYFSRGQECVENAGFSVVREFVGHGIGRSLHEDPQLPNYGIKNTGIRLKAGMTFAIEPMVNMGNNEIYIKENGWTAATKDGSLSAHFEHTVVITNNGPEILSKL